MRIITHSQIGYIHMSKSRYKQYLAEEFPPPSSAEVCSTEQQGRDRPRFPPRPPALKPPPPDRLTHLLMSYTLQCTGHHIPNLPGVFIVTLLMSSEVHHTPNTTGALVAIFPTHLHLVSSSSHSLLTRLMSSALYRSPNPPGVIFMTRPYCVTAVDTIVLTHMVLLEAHS